MHGFCRICCQIAFRKCGASFLLNALHQSRFSLISRDYTIRLICILFFFRQLLVTYQFYHRFTTTIRNFTRNFAIIQRTKRKFLNNNAKSLIGKYNSKINKNLKKMLQIIIIQMPNSLLFLSSRVLYSIKSIHWEWPDKRLGLTR